MANKQTNWEKQTLEKIAEQESITYLGAAHPNLEPHEHPNFKVYDWTPNKHLDGDIRYKLAGPEHSIILQSSLLTAWHDVWVARNAFIKFEDWFELWEEGFKALITRPNTNYPATGQNTWRKELESRPRYREWKNPNKKAKVNKLLRVIEYWPDRSVESKSYILSGSDIDLIQQIIRIHSQPAGSSSTSNESGYGGEVVTFRGKPKITLYFLEKEEDVEEGYRALMSRISFHIMNKSDNPNSDLPTLTNTDVRQIATQIQNLFAKPTPYKIHRGKETVSIKDKSRGYDGYCHVYNKSDGIDLYTKICQVQNHTIDLKRVFHKVTLDEVNAYPTVPPSVKVLGQTVKEPRHRPVGWVHFTEAKLFLGLLDTPVKLCDAKGFLFDGVDTTG